MSETPQSPAGALVVAPPAQSRSFSRAALTAIAVGLLLVVVGLALVPKEATLGSNVRMVFFHGAVTWNGILMAAAAGLVGIYTVLSSRGSASPVASSPADPTSSGSKGDAVGWAAFVRGTALWRLLSLATGFWVLSLTLSFPVMIRTWGGVLWNEPKLLMSAELVSLFLVCWAVSYFVGRPRVTALCAMVSAGVMVALLATTPGAFHPDNPIMGSGNPRFIGTFAAILVGLVTASLGLALLRRSAPGGERS